SLWRPLVDVVKDAPLAFCDRWSIELDEPVPCNKAMEDYVDESYYLKYRASHKWFWLSNQTRDKVAAFVIWDSKSDAKYLGEIPGN
ncbi:hypothetical protein CC78DRAFT_453765, partial [Lojkania enalia]